jgi:hypothetical protein
VLSEIEFYLPAESVAGMAGDTRPVATLTSPDGGTPGSVLART